MDNHYCRIKNIIFGLGCCSTVVAAAQLVSYLLYLRLSCREAVVDYIVVLTTLFWVNAVYLWHSTRLLYLLREGTVSRRSLASSRTWFYVALAYLMTTVVCVLVAVSAGLAAAGRGAGRPGLHPRLLRAR